MRALLPIALALAFLSTAALLGRAPAPAESQSAAAREFLSALDDAGRARATAAFDAPARSDWHFVPRERAGLALRDMNDAQRLAARRLIASGLSAQGVLTLEGILQLEQVLLELDRARGVTNSIRDPGAYQLLVCGEPGSDRWSWRIEGHHVSVHFTHVGGATRATPLFWGTNPGEVQSGPQAGLRVLGEREEAARALAGSLSADQRTRAGVGGEVPADVLHLPAVLTARERAGIAAAELDAEQRAQLRALFEQHARDLRGELAAAEIERIAAAGDALCFRWLGTLEPGKPCYYSIEGPGFAIEYVNVQNGANHAHLVWRDFERDLGRDLLREHLEAERER
jgi:Protein of unknown function (DUF3500)